MTALYRMFDGDGRLLYVGISEKQVGSRCGMTATVHLFARPVHAAGAAVPSGVAPPSPGGAVAATHPTPASRVGGPFDGAA